MNKVELGQRYTDSISGFRGKAIGYAEYLNGCRQVLLKASSEDNKPGAEEWIDEGQLEDVEPASAPGGGMRSHPQTPAGL
jgi:hypothetical protein